MVVGAPPLETFVRFSAARTILIAAALTVTVSFGLFKQVKMMWGAGAAVVGPHVEPGADARFLKSRLEELASGRLKEARIQYASDRVDGARSAGEFHYDAQYGFAPYLVHYRPVEEADYYLLDFISQEALSDYVAEHGLTVIAGSGFLAVAEKSGPNPSRA